MSKNKISESSLLLLNNYLKTTVMNLNIAMVHGFITCVTSLPIAEILKYELTDDTIITLLDLEQVPEEVNVQYLIDSVEEILEATTENIIDKDNFRFILSEKGFARITKNKLNLICEWCLGYSMALSRYKDIIEELLEKDEHDVAKCYDTIKFMAEGASTAHEPNINWLSPEIESKANKIDISKILLEQLDTRKEIMFELKHIIKYIFDTWNSYDEDPLSDEYGEYEEIDDAEIDLMDFSDNNTSNNSYDPIIKNNTSATNNIPCPCGSGKKFVMCCEVAMQQSLIH